MYLIVNKIVLWSTRARRPATVKNTEAGLYDGGNGQHCPVHARSYLPGGAEQKDDSRQDRDHRGAASANPYPIPCTA
jgi:hypothetical protein